MPGHSDADAASQRLLDAAREVFGYEQLRPGQAEAVRALLAGRDVLLVLPTGAGKSLAYQLAGQLQGSTTLVVSPLLALQQDQIDALTERSRLRAERVSSAETDAHRDEVMHRAAEGQLDFVFLAPEQLARTAVQAQLEQVTIGLVAVDEAHCVSVWGHDFRPDYFRLGELVDAIGRPPVLALTATAAPPVRADIIERLRLRDPLTIVRGLARENIHLGVHRCVSGDDQRSRLLQAVTSTAGQGIVYVRTRRAAQEYADAFDAAGLRAAAYHAGLGKKVRSRAHERFSAGDIDVMVATSAFGMGVDKPDIRYVFHAHAPDSLDSYYQEVGRAGRDGQPATALLLYRPEDAALSKFFTAGVPDLHELAAVADVVAATTGAAPAAADVAEATGVSARRAARLVNLLSEVEPASPHAWAQAAQERATAHRAIAESRIEMMRGYADTLRCRREFLLGYFGEELDEPCGACDTCSAGTSAEQPEQLTAAPWSLNSAVEHETFGSGTVMEVGGDEVTVLFDKVGYRTLHLPTVRDKGLLDSA